MSIDYPGSIACSSKDDFGAGNFLGVDFWNVFAWRCLKWEHILQLHAQVSVSNG